MYWLKPITTDVARAITKAHTTKKPSRQTRAMEDVVDTAAVNDALLDHAISRWQGVTDSGQPAPCDLAHKLMLPVDVQAALIERAQVGAADKGASFRESADVLPVLGR